MEILTQLRDYTFVLGVSLSGEEIHACLFRVGDEHAFTERFTNNITGLHSLKKWSELQSCGTLNEALACLEYAGSNIQMVVQYFLKNDVKVWLQSPLQLKRNLRLPGDSSKITADLIAHYAFVHRDKATPITLIGLEIEKLKDLQVNYKRVAKAILILESGTAKVALRDAGSAQTLEQLNTPALQGLKESLSCIEERISHYTFSLKLSLHQNGSAENNRRHPELME